MRILALWNDTDVPLTPGLSTTAIAADGGYGRSAVVAYNLAAAQIEAARLWAQERPSLAAAG
jgi:hypothetical protein